MRSLVLTLYPLLIGVVAAQPQPPALRLGSTVRPLRYAADLTLNPKQDDFQGAIDISLRLAEPVSLFWLNATGLQVYKAEMRTDSGSIVVKIVPGGEEFVGFSFDSPIPAGTARLRLNYSGKVNRKSSAGLFGNPSGNDAYLHAIPTNRCATRVSVLR